MQGKDFSLQNILEQIEYQDRRRVRKAIYLSDKLNVELVCYKPGQFTPEHIHPSQDEFFYTVRGTGTITIDSEEHEVKEGDTLYVFEGQKHAFENRGDDDWVLMFVKSPGSTLSSLKK